MQIVSLAPRLLADVWDDIERVAAALERAREGAALVDACRERLATLAAETAPLARPVVACIEWLDPLMIAGNWIPELVELAGGAYPFAAAGAMSHVTSWQAVLDARPEVAVLMPCGFTIAQTRRELPALARRAAVASAASGARRARERRRRQRLLQSAGSAARRKRGNPGGLDPPRGVRGAYSCGCRRADRGVTLASVEPRRGVALAEPAVSLIERYQAYADDFERTFVDDDWSRLEQYFTVDAVYSTPANGLRVSGRDAILTVLRAAVSGFDRRCDTRTLETVLGPRETGNEVVREWAATFTLRGAPPLHIGGSERAVFRGERIELLEVTLTAETLDRLMTYASAYLVHH